jgi:hypothetical protein
MRSGEDSLEAQITEVFGHSHVGEIEDDRRWMQATGFSKNLLRIVAHHQQTRSGVSGECAAQIFGVRCVFAQYYEC